jgi:hypothetical protein
MIRRNSPRPHDAPCGRPARAAAFFLLALAFASCGYSFSGSALPSHVKTVAVPVFHNNTLEYDLERELTQEVIAAFVRDNSLRVVGEKDADAVLTGRITGYENKVFSYSAGETAEEYLVKITVSAVLKDQVENKELWKQDALSATATYAVVDRPGKPATTEQEGRRAAIRELSEVIFARTMEEW